MRGRKRSTGEPGTITAEERGTALVTVGTIGTVSDGDHFDPGMVAGTVTRPFTTITLADGILFAAAIAAVFDLSDHYRAGITVWVVLFGTLLRTKFVLLDRMSLRLPEWLAFVIPSLAFWTLLYFLT